MNWLTTFLVYVLNIRSVEDFCVCRESFFLENNFWSANQDNLKYLYKVMIDEKCKSGYAAGFDLFPETSYLLKSTNLRYAVLKYSMIENDFTGFLMSPEDDKFFWYFRFYFKDKPFDNLYSSEMYGGKMLRHESFMWPEKIINIKLRCDVTTDFIMKHIRKIFEKFITMKLSKFNDYVQSIGENNLKEKLNMIENSTMFDSNIVLYYFENYSECFLNLKGFITDLCHFKLVNDGLFDYFFKFFNYLFNTKPTNSLKVSQFREVLNEKVNENFKKMNIIKIEKTASKTFFDGCFSYLKNEILENNIFLPINDKYNINYYIDQLSNLIFETMKQNLEISATYKPELKTVVIIDLFKQSLVNLQVSIMKNLFESEYFAIHFLKKKVETLNDYSDVENMVCDYYNMFAFIIKLYYKTNKNTLSYSYCPSVSTNKYNIRIINGILIKFNFFANLGEIKGFDDKGKEIIIVKDTDYFLDEFGVVHFPSKALKMKNIHEIEVISSNDKQNRKRFMVNDYLGGKKNNKLTN